MSQELLSRLWEGIKQDGQIMVGLRKNAEHHEPMHAHVDDDKDDCLWIFMKKDNRVADGGKSMSQFVGKDHKLFACMCGQLVPETDTSYIDKFWSNAVEAWFEGGKEDPELLLMRLDLESAEIWSKDPTFTGVIKLASGSKVAPEDVGEHTLVEFTD